MSEPTAWWKRPASMSWLALIGIALAVTLVAGGIGAAAALTLTAGPGSCNTERVAQNALPAVVTVLVSSSSASGSGSGSIIRSDGVVLTNDHVIAPAGTSGTIEVLLNDGERLSRIAGRQPTR